MPARYRHRNRFITLRRRLQPDRELHRPSPARQSASSVPSLFRSRQRLLLLFNAYWGALDFDLSLAPAAAVSGWQQWIDASREAPGEIMDGSAALPVAGTRYRVAPRSVEVLFAGTDDCAGPVIELKPKPG